MRKEIKILKNEITIKEIYFNKYLHRSPYVLGNVLSTSEKSSFNTCNNTMKKCTIIIPILWRRKMMDTISMRQEMLLKNCYCRKHSMALKKQESSTIARK